MNKSFTCNNQLTNIYKSASPKSEIVSQILFGEKFYVTKKNKLFYEGFSVYDHYKGYVLKKHFIKTELTKNSRIILKKSFLYTAPDNNKKTKKYLLFNSLVSIIDKKNNFIKINKYWIKKNSINKTIIKSNNFLKKIFFFLKTKYLWGGNSILGIDCSGLVQELMKSINKKCPRDSKDQLKFFKKNVSLNNIKSGDLLFWKGHVAIALNKKKLIHAYGPKKKVIIMSITNVINILSKKNLPLVAIKRPL